MSADGAIANFVQTYLAAANAAAAIPQYVGTLQDTWLNAFYGDKRRLREFIEHTAEASGLGKISTGYLEQSNVDLSTEFTDMIVTQRGFQANTKIVSTVDSMLNDVINMKQ